MGFDCCRNNVKIKLSVVVGFGCCCVLDPKKKEESMESWRKRRSEKQYTCHTYTISILLTNQRFFYVVCVRASACVFSHV